MWRLISVWTFLSRLIWKGMEPIQALYRAEGVFDGSAPELHRAFGRLVHSLLHGVDHRFMFPAGDPALKAARALRLLTTRLAAGPIPLAMQDEPSLYSGHVVRQELTGGSAVDVMLRQIGKVLLAEAAIGIGA